MTPDDAAASKANPTSEGRFRGFGYWAKCLFGQGVRGIQSLAPTAESSMQPTCFSGATLAQSEPWILLYSQSV